MTAVLGQLFALKQSKKKFKRVRNVFALFFFQQNLGKLMSREPPCFYFGTVVTNACARARSQDVYVMLAFCLVST